MYLFELITRFIKGKKYKKVSDFDPFKEDDIEMENSENCDHIFLPIDSSGEMLACSKCGLLVPKDKLKDINIFKQ